MPLFHRKTDQEKQQDDEQRRQFDEERALQDASLVALQQGGIPIQAQRRLDDVRQRGGFFTSDLTVNEFVLTRASGFQPLSQVMGSSIYHVGWQYMPRYSSSQELTVLTQALNHARRLALGRLSEEARRVGANAVVGVHVTRSSYDWGRELIEFNTVGTAIRVEGAAPSEWPGLTNLSGQDFWKLHQAGYRPLGVVAASTVYYVLASWQQQMSSSWWAGRWNQELIDFTQGLYTARHFAMNNVWQEAAELGASGIVGMEIEQETEEYEVEVNDSKRTDMIVTFHAMGTAIVEASEQAPAPAAYAALSLKT